jgi:AcrR family transcriptional regulator
MSTVSTKPRAKPAKPAKTVPAKRASVARPPASKSTAGTKPAKKADKDGAKTVGPIGREALLDAAVRRFSTTGFDGTTMRDIAALSGMLAGSIYYYYPTKEQLFLAVHEYAIEHICESVRRAVDPDAEPWTRLTQAAQGYLESMLKEFEYASIIITEFPQRRSPELRDALIAHRQKFEALFAAIIADVPLRRGVDRTYFRLGILGMLAWSYVWYSPKGADSPKVIARKMVNMLRESTAPA